MTLDEIIGYCLNKPGAYLDWPFGPQYAVVKVRAPGYDRCRIFAQPFELRGQPVVTLNCDAATGLYYRSLYPDAVTRGWHCPPIQQPYFNTVKLDGTVPDDEIARMIDHAYDTVVSRLPKYMQQALINYSQR